MRWIVALAAIALVNVTVARPSKESLPSLGDPAHTCKPELCKLPDCRCSTPDIPGDIDAAKVPQVFFSNQSILVGHFVTALYERLCRWFWSHSTMQWTLWTTPNTSSCSSTASIRTGARPRPLSSYRTSTPITRWSTTSSTEVTRSRRTPSRTFQSSPTIPTDKLIAVWVI